MVNITSIDFECPEYAFEIIFKVHWKCKHSFFLAWPFFIQWCFSLLSFLLFRLFFEKKERLDWLVQIKRIHMQNWSIFLTSDLKITHWLQQCLVMTVNHSECQSLWQRGEWHYTFVHINVMIKKNILLLNYVKPKHIINTKWHNACHVLLKLSLKIYVHGHLFFEFSTLSL